MKNSAHQRATTLAWIQPFWALAWIHAPPIGARSGAIQASTGAVYARFQQSNLGLVDIIGTAYACSKRKCPWAWQVIVNASRVPPEAKISVHDRHEVARLEPGAHFGEQALLKNQLRTADVVAMSTVCALDISQRASNRSLAKRSLTDVEVDWRRV